MYDITWKRKLNDTTMAAKPDLIPTLLTHPVVENAGTHPDTQLSCSSALSWGLYFALFLSA